MLYRSALIWNGHGFEPGDLRFDSHFREVGQLRASPGEEVYNCDGAYLLPGLWDSHIHLLLLARALGQVDLSDCRNKGDLLDRIARAQGEWVEGHGWNQSHWEDAALPELAELDRACGGRPCWLTRADLHSALANSEALRRAGVEARTPDPPGGRIERDAEGHLTGLLADRAQLVMERVLALPEGERLEKLLRQAATRLNAWGITGVCDQRLKDLDDGPLARTTYAQLRLPLRIHCNRGAHEDLSSGPRFLEGDDWLRCGHVKFFSDGSLGSRTARMLEPYEGSNERGLWLTNPEELKAGFARAHDHGFPVSVHAIGDEAVREVLRLLPAHPLDRIEHLQIAQDDDLRPLNMHSPVASMQPLHLLDDRHQADLLLGERARGYYRLNTLQQQRVRLSFGSDAPVASADPWLGLQAACQRRRGEQEKPWFADECLDRRAALHAYTEGACLSLGWRDAGKIGPGYLADFCLVDRDPLQCPWLAEIRVLHTVVHGRTKLP